MRVCAGGKRAERARVRACAHSRGSRRGARPEGARGQAGEQTCARVRADGVASGRCGVRGAPNVGACAHTRERSRLKACTARGADERWRAEAATREGEVGAEARAWRREAAGTGSARRGRKEKKEKRKKEKGEGKRKNRKKK